MSIEILPFTIQVIPSDLIKMDYATNFLTARIAVKFEHLGNTALLKEMKLSILSNAKSSKKEKESLLKVISEIPVDGTVLLLSL